MYFQYVDINWWQILMKNWLKMKLYIKFSAWNENWWNEDLKIEDDLKNEYDLEDLKNEDNLKNEDDPKNKNGLKYEGNGIWLGLH